MRKRKRERESDGVRVKEYNTNVQITGEFFNEELNRARNDTEITNKKAPLA